MLASDLRRLEGVVATGVIGLTSIIWGVLVAIKGARTRKWRTTHGVITGSLVEPDWRDRSGYQFYRVVISYTFSVAGTSRTGHQLCVGDGGGGLSLQDAQRRAQRYAPGTALDVYYDPLDSSHAVLERGISGNTVAAILFGLLTLSVGAWLLLRGPAPLRPQTPHVPSGGTTLSVPLVTLLLLVLFVGVFWVPVRAKQVRAKQRKVGVALLLLWGGASLLLYWDARHGYQEGWPVYLFAGVALACAVVWSYLVANVGHRE